MFPLKEISIHNPKSEEEQEKELELKMYIYILHLDSKSAVRVTKTGWNSSWIAVLVVPPLIVPALNWINQIPLVSHFVKKKITSWVNMRSFVPAMSHFTGFFIERNPHIAIFVKEVSLVNISRSCTDFFIDGI